MWQGVVRDMEEQFIPNLRKPLDIAEVLRLAEEQAESGGYTNTRYLIGLATLNVHLGRDARAIEWCNRAEASIERFRQSMDCPEWMLKQEEFNWKLRDAVRTGRGKAFLAGSAKASDASGQ